MSQLKAIRSVESETKQSNILGVFEGECADSNITNENGLDITREVWEHTFASEDYRRGIDNGWFIGYLGHPDDPGYQHFQDGCILMTEGRIDDDGKVYGKFNLIDTPVGRIVKTFIDAGVQFGISVRGAGDIISNSVDPETFVFRGFDLVAFPAFPESIPEFTAIAASSDVETQKKYKAICAAVDTNLKGVNSIESLKQLQASFAPNSKQYKEIESRITELSDEKEEADKLENIDDVKLAGMTDLYLEKCEECDRIKVSNEALRKELKTANSTYDRKIKVLNRIVSNQQMDIEAAYDKLEKDYNVQIKANMALTDKLNTVTRENLTYKCKINASSDDLSKKDAIIASLRTKLGETVAGVKGVNERSSNLDAKVRELKDEVSATRKLLNEFQLAYANLYSTAVGADLSQVTITSSTTVKELKDSVSRSLGTPIFASTDPIPVDVEDVEYDDDNSLITM